jgi:hypothetical protein
MGAMACENTAVQKIRSPASTDVKHADDRNRHVRASVAIGGKPAGRSQNDDASD